MGTRVTAEYQAERGNPELSKWALWGAIPVAASGVGLTTWGVVVAFQDCSDELDGECFPPPAFLIGFGAVEMAMGAAGIWWYLWSREEKFVTYEELGSSQVDPGLKLMLDPPGFAARSERLLLQRGEGLLEVALVLRGPAHPAHGALTIGHERDRQLADAEAPLQRLSHVVDDRKTQPVALADGPRGRSEVVLGDPDEDHVGVRLVQALGSGQGAFTRLAIFREELDDDWPAAVLSRVDLLPLERSPMKIWERFTEQCGLRTWRHGGSAARAARAR